MRPWPRPELMCGLRCYAIHRAFLWRCRLWCGIATRWCLQWGVLVRALRCALPVLLVTKAHKSWGTLMRAKPCTWQIADGSVSSTILRNKSFFFLVNQYSYLCYLEYDEGMLTRVETRLDCPTSGECQPLPLGIPVLLYMHLSLPVLALLLPFLPFRSLLS